MTFDKKKFIHQSWSQPWFSTEVWFTGLAFKILWDCILIITFDWKVTIFCLNMLCKNFMDLLYLKLFAERGNYNKHHKLQRCWSNTRSGGVIEQEGRQMGTSSVLLLLARGQKVVGSNPASTKPFQKKCHSKVFWVSTHSIKYLKKVEKIIWATLAGRSQMTNTS